MLAILTLCGAGLASSPARADRTSGRPACRTHTVADGQSLRSIARRYNVSIDALREQNGLGAGVVLKPGTTLGAETDDLFLDTGMEVDL